MCCDLKNKQTNNIYSTLTNSNFWVVVGTYYIVPLTLLGLNKSRENLNIFHVSTLFRLASPNANMSLFSRFQFSFGHLCTLISFLYLEHILFHLTSSRERGERHPTKNPICDRREGSLWMKIKTNGLTNSWCVFRLDLLFHTADNFGLLCDIKVISQIELKSASHLILTNNF